MNRVYNSNDPAFSERNGEPCFVVAMIERDAGQETMFRVRFRDGVEQDVFDSELTRGKDN